MARRKSNYRRSSGSGKGAWAIIAVIVIFLLLIGLTVAAAIGSSGFTNAEFKAWFDYWGKGAPVVFDNEKPTNTGKPTEAPVTTKPEQSESAEPSEPAGELINNVMVTPSVLNEMTYSISKISETEDGYVLTVDCGETYANLEVGYNLTWASSSPLYDWIEEGEDVEDYVSVFQLSHEFIINANEPFGCPALLNIYLITDDSVNCTVQLDYLKRVLDPVINNESLSFLTPGSIGVTYGLTIGTIESEVQFGELAVQPGDELQAATGIGAGVKTLAGTYGTEGVSYKLPSPFELFGGEDDNGAEYNLNFCRACTGVNAELVITYGIRYVVGGNVLITERSAPVSVGLSLEGYYDAENDQVIESALLSIPEGAPITFATVTDGVVEIYGNDLIAAEGSYIYCRSASVTLSVVQEIFADHEVTAYKTNGKEITKNTTSLGTGMRIIIDDIEFFVFLRGDIDGNGTINSSDKMLLVRFTTGESTATGITALAADINRDGIVDDADAELMTEYFNGNYDIV